MQNYQLTHHKSYSKIAYEAMASPCEILLRNLDPDFCNQIAKKAYLETKRIENKFSRYITGNLVDRMNNNHGQPVQIDQECFKLLEYAKNLFEISDELFDITSGVLRKGWKFHPDSIPPTKNEINLLKKHIGFDRLSYDAKYFSMPKAMQIDFGGIGKEYAVDQVANIIRPSCEKSLTSFLVNFGGDLSSEKYNAQDPAWVVGLESAKNDSQTDTVITLSSGSVATSGTSKRFLEYQGKRYGHLLNPKTGYPIEGAPCSITAFASSCVLAGSFSSLAMLQGVHAENFLKEQDVKYICLW